MICIISAELFTKIIESIKDLNPDANFDFTKEGLHMQVMDNAHVSLSSLTLTKDNFQQYQCENDLTLGINLKSLTLVLKNSKGPLYMSSQGDKLNLNVEKNSGTAHYVFNLMDIESEQLGLPEITYDAVALLPSSTFAKVIRDVSELSDTCSIHIDKYLKISASGDIGQVKWQSSDDCECKLQNKTDSLLFGLRYMCLFSKAASLSSQVTISLKSDTPMCLTFPIGSGYLRFYLAPKESDE